MKEITFEDIEILNEEKQVVHIGPKKKPVVLDMLSISRYYDIFIPKFLEIIQHFQSVVGNITLPTEGKEYTDKDLMTKLYNQIQQGLSNKKARRSFIKLLKSVGFMGMSRAYFEKYCKVPQMIDIFVHVYRFNVNGVKKKVELVRSLILDTSPQSQTSIHTPSKKAGLKQVLKPRYQRLPD